MQVVGYDLDRPAVFGVSNHVLQIRGADTGDQFERRCKLGEIELGRRVDEYELRDRLNGVIRLGVGDQSSDVARDLGGVIDKTRG